MQSTNLLTGWGKRLTEARTAKGLSISELARRTGTHKSHLARFERGEAGLGDAARIRVAAEVGHEVAELFPYPSTTPENTCPSAAPAMGEATSPTPATTAETRSNALTAAAPEPSACEESNGND